MHGPKESRAAAEAQDGAEVTRLHRELDAAVAPLLARHGERLRCRLGCAECCVDELTVFAVEAERIRREYPEVLREEPGPRGACAFLDGDGACRVYEARPYVCRTQGLPLRWVEGGGEGGDAGEVELRDICPLNDEGGEPIEALPPEDCWTLGPWEGRLALLQSRRSGGELVRIGLRELFGAGAGAPIG